MNEIESKATELARMVQQQIFEAREELAKRMIDNGLNPELYGIADNFEEVVNNPTIAYNCWPVLKLNPRMGRANNTGDQ